MNRVVKLLETGLVPTSGGGGGGGRGEGEKGMFCFYQLS